MTIFSLGASICYAGGMSFNFKLYAKSDDDNKWVYGYRFSEDINYLLDTEDQRASVGLYSKSDSSIGSLYFKACKKNEVNETITGVATITKGVASINTKYITLNYYPTYQLKTGRYDLYSWTKIKDCTASGSWNP